MEFLYRFSFDAFENPVRLILTLIFVLVYLVFSYRGVKALNGSKKFILFVLRIIIIIFIVIISGELSIKKPAYSEERREIAILIDSSKSMSIKSENPVLTRLDAVKEYLRNNKELFENLKKDYNLVFYSFNNDIKKISESAINEIKPSGNGTNILKALNTAVQKSEHLSAVLLFSDGRDTEGLQHGLSDFKFPIQIFSFSPGSGTEKDVALRNLSSSGFALNREKYELSFEITMKGWKELDVPLTLKGENSVIKTERVNLKDGETKRIRMEFTPQRVGKQLFTIETPVFTGDDYPQNNRLNFILNVLRDRLRVLLISGKPYWDLRFLRQVLKTSPWIDLVNFNILRTPFDLVNIPEIELSLIPFPADEIFREGLESFDVFIMQNFDPSQFVPPVYLRNVLEFVKNGGGLAIVGGTLLSKANFYLNTEMADAIPVSSLSGDRSGRFRPVLAKDAMNHPINRIFRKYKDLPSIDFINGVRGIKSWATVLAQTEESNMPLVVAGNLGRGKVLAILTDSLWRFAFSPEQKRATSDAFVDFWLNALRWLSGEPDESNILIESAKDSFDPGENIKLNLRTLDKRYLPFKNSPVEIKVVDIDSGRTVFNKEWKMRGGEEIVEFNIEEKGIYNAILQVREGGKIVESTESKIVVKDRKGEMETPFTDEELLRTLAEKSGGRSYNLNERTNIEKILKNKKMRSGTGYEKKIPIWNSKWIYFSLIFLLSSEWFFRRRWGLK